MFSSPTSAIETVKLNSSPGFTRGGPKTWAMVRSSLRRRFRLGPRAPTAPAIPLAQCHGAPGVKWSKFSERLNPGPADLSEIAKERMVSAIFWVVKNGIHMTGMPSFAKIGVPDNQLWQITAFVKKL